MNEPVRKRIEQAAIAALKPMRDAYLKATDVYAAELSAGNLDELKEALLGRVPGILVATGASVPVRTISPRLAVERMVLELYLVSGSMRSMVDRHQGDGGIYQMIDEQRPLLMGKSMGVKGVGLPQIGPVKALVKTKTLHVWLVEYEVDVTVSGAAETDLGYREIEVNHKLITNELTHQQTGVLVTGLIDTEA